jgi:iron complex outermembrane receptor protein
VPNTPVLGGSDCFGNPSDNDPLKGSTDFDTYFERTHYAITATLEHEFENGVTLTSITDWQDFEKLYNEDSDSTPQTIFHYFSDVDSNQFSQELRFAGETEQSRWVAGVYYLNIDSEGRAGVEATGSLGVTMDNLWALDTTSYAVFAQYEYDFSENWTTIVGLRWTEDDKEFDSNPRCTFEPNFQGLDFDNCFIFLPQVQGTGADDDRSEGEWSGNIELNWSSEENLLVYGKISKGHKAGGYNGGVISFFDQVDLTYDAEIPITYELGLKTAFWDGKARFNGAVFYTDYEDFQTFTQRGPSLILFNIDAEVTGAELELVLNPAQGWDFLFGVSLLDGEMQDLDGAGGIQDRQMSNAPDLSYNALGRYEWSSFGGGMMAVQVDMNYVDDRVLNAIGDPGLADDSYSLWNASIEWRNDNLMVRAWVKNLTDEEYTPTSFDITGITGGTQRVASPPQWYGATVSYHF